MSRVFLSFRGALLAFGLLAGLPGQALELADSRWGFDGTVLPGRVNLVSFRLFNADTAPFDGVVRLERSSFSGTVGAVHEARVYVSPQTYRWVQFQVEATGGNDTHVFRYPLMRGREESKSFSDLKRGSPARVLLLDPADTSAIPARMPAFPADAFPASVSGLEALEQLVLDHKPDWDAPRRQALLDWIHLGGALHLLQDREGRHPRFDAELAGLNTPGARTRLGSGWVVRHDFSRREATAARLDEAGFPGSRWAREGSPQQYAATGVETAELLQSLKSFIRPQHPWGMINLLLLTYIAMVGPGQYFLVRKRNLDYRLSLLLLLGLVGLFSVVFYQIGLRGYKNPSLVLSVSRATVLPGDRVALVKWGQIFTRSGRTAELRHPGAAGMYDLPGLEEKVPVTAVNGAQAVLTARMPVNSTLPLVYRGVLPLKVSGLEVAPGRDGKPGLRFTGTPPPGLIEGVWLDRVTARRLSMRPDGSIEVLESKPRDAHVKSLTASMEVHAWSHADVPPNLEGFLESRTFRGRHLPAWLGRVIQATVGIDPGQNYRDWLPDPAWRGDGQDVFLAGAAQPETALTGEGFQKQPGITIYHWRLPPAGASSSPTP